MCNIQTATIFEPLLLFLLPPSCMVVFIRELVNLKLQDNQPELSKHYSMDIKIDMPKEHSASSSLNSFRETSPISAVFYGLCRVSTNSTQQPDLG